MKQLSPQDLKMIFSNPFYCITVDPIFSEKHDYIVKEEMWIKAGVNLIKEIGSEEYLKLLLKNIKGEYI